MIIKLVVLLRMEQEPGTLLGDTARAKRGKVGKAVEM